MQPLSRKEPLVDVKTIAEEKHFAAASAVAPPTDVNSTSNSDFSAAPAVSPAAAGAGRASSSSKHLWCWCTLCPYTSTKAPLITN